MQVTILGKLGLETAQPNEEEKKAQKEKVPKMDGGQSRNTRILAVLKSGFGMLWGHLGNTFFRWCTAGNCRGDCSTLERSNSNAFCHFGSTETPLGMTSRKTRRSMVRVGLLKLGLYRISP